jgi:hypothetical protein
MAMGDALETMPDCRARAAPSYAGAGKRRAADDANVIFL